MNSSVRVENSKISATRGVDAYENSYAVVLNNQIDAGGTAVYIHESSGSILNNTANGGGIGVEYSNGVNIVSVGNGRTAINVELSNGVSIFNSEKLMVREH